MIASIFWTSAFQQITSRTKFKTNTILHKRLKIDFKETFLTFGGSNFSRQYELWSFHYLLKLKLKKYTDFIISSIEV